jgi:hypothetical protein
MVHSSDVVTFHYAEEAPQFESTPSEEKKINTEIELSEVKADDSDRKQRDEDKKFYQYFSALARTWTDLPDLTISYSSLSYSITVPKKEHKIETVGSRIRGMFRRKAMKEFHALSSVSGIIRPGKMVLVLAPPGIDTLFLNIMSFPSLFLSFQVMENHRF